MSASQSFSQPSSGLDCSSGWVSRASDGIPVATVPQTVRGVSGEVGWAGSGRGIEFDLVGVELKWGGDIDNLIPSRDRISDEGVCGPSRDEVDTNVPERSTLADLSRWYSSSASARTRSLSSRASLSLFRRLRFSISDSNLSRTSVGTIPVQEHSRKLTSQPIGRWLRSG